MNTMGGRERRLLYAGIEDPLPAECEGIEFQRRRLSDPFRHWGRKLLIPPLGEYPERLLTPRWARRLRLPRPLHDCGSCVGMPPGDG